MSKRLFVGNLPWGATEEEVTDWFATQQIEVRWCKVVFDRETGRSRGFAFVDVDDKDLPTALQADGEYFDSRQLRINEANQREPRQGA